MFEKVNSRHIIEVGAHFISHTDPLQTMTKIVARTIDIAERVFASIPAYWSALGEQLKDALIIFDSLNILVPLRQLLCKSEKGKYFLFDTTKTWQKKVDRIFLTASYSLKTYRGFVRTGLASFGVLSKNVIGQLPVFHLVTDGLSVLSSGFGAWDLLITLAKNQKKNSVSSQKLEKWKHRSAQIELLKQNDPSTLMHFKHRYYNKLALINGELEKSNCLRSRLDLIEKKQGKLLAEELSATVINGDGGKIDRWETIHGNGNLVQKHKLLALCYSISKIAGIVMSLIAVSIYGAFWTFPVAIFILSFSNGVDLVRMARLYYEEFSKPKPIRATPPKHVLHPLDS